MGNYVSCTLSSLPGKNSRRVAKVIFPTNEIRELSKPVKAAELMMENPNFFLVNTKSMQMGKRFPAMHADEDLEMGNVYVFFPMKRLNSTVAVADMGPLFLKAKSADKKRGIGRVRVLPECCDLALPESDVSVPKLNLDDIEEYSTPESQHRLSFCRSKKPLLETIVEEPACLRRC